jgi:plasmid maintenance system antidote protein VapI
LKRIYITNQTKLASVIGVTIQHLSKVKHGKSGVSDALAQLLEQMTGIKRTLWMSTTRIKTLQRELDTFFKKQKEEESISQRTIV